MFLVIKPTTWEDMRQLVANMHGRWAFRGQASETWGLSTSLERALIQTDNRGAVEQKEKVLLREFRRRAHHYVPSPPSDNEDLEWLALIQHHGGATRLLDFSHSFYVAIFFAVERNPGGYDNSAVWAINLHKLDDAAIINFNAIFENKNKIGENLEQQYVSLAQRILNAGKSNSNKCVLAVAPERMNERLAVQQGLFLFPCDIGASFEENLAEVFNSKEKVFQNTPTETYSVEKHTLPILEKATVVKIIVPRYLREVVLHDLWKMNISPATLFPGIDGFTRSLNYHLLEP